jgi:predicted membrane protein
MRSQGRILIGSAIILFGLMLLIGNLFQIDVGALCFPTALILLGFWLLLRVWLIQPQTAPKVRVFGPVKREGAWQVTDEEIWLVVGDLILDFGQAEIPPGETTIQAFGFVNSIRVFVPEGVGLAVSSTAFLTDAKFLGRKQEAFVMPLELASDNYETAERKIRLETLYFVADIRVMQA